MTDPTPRERREAAARRLAEVLADLEHEKPATRALRDAFAATVEDRSRPASTASTAGLLAESLAPLLAPVDGPGQPAEAPAPPASSAPAEEPEAPAQEVDTSSASTPEEAAFLRSLQS